MNMERTAYEHGVNTKCTQRCTHVHILLHTSALDTPGHSLDTHWTVLKIDNPYIYKLFAIPLDTHWTLRWCALGCASLCARYVLGVCLGCACAVLGLCMGCARAVHGVRHATFRSSDDAII